MRIAHRIHALFMVSISLVFRGGLASVLLCADSTATAVGNQATETTLGLEDASITPAPDLFELHRRQESTISYLLAPDETCGFDSKGSAMQCASGYPCAFISASVASLSARQVCCYSTGCPANIIRRTACRDSTVACESSCQSNRSIMRCTSSSFPYCHTMHFGTSTIVGFQCRASTYAGTPNVLSTTSSGGPARSYASHTATRASTVSIRTTITRSGSAITITTVLDPEPEASSSVDINEYIDRLDGQERSMRDQIGAIVGGTVGGVVFLVVVAVVGILLIRRKKKRKAELFAGGGSGVGHQSPTVGGADGSYGYYHPTPSHAGSTYPPVSPSLDMGTIPAGSAPHSPRTEWANKTRLLTAGGNLNHRLSEVDGSPDSQIHELPAR